jgi:beta-alanine--pyruvate transaminase
MDNVNLDVAPNDLEAYWMPMTANRRFKSAPAFFVEAKGMHYKMPDGRRMLDAIAGLWCVNAGHCHPKIIEAIRLQAGKLDYASSFSLGHPLVFHYANRLREIMPMGFDHVFLAGSGSEAVDTALKLALAYHRARGEGHRQRLIGRQRSYHGMGFGGLSVSGIGWQRAQFGVMLPGVSHLPHTHDLSRNAFSKGQPEHGVEFADALEGLLPALDPSTVAAVIVEPVAGAGGVLPPPIGYLERLREICSKHGILLIFDEVVTGFGRLGAPFAAQALGVTPDLITCAKGMSNGAVPMGGVLVHHRVHEAMSRGPEAAVEFAHGYTYSGHPLACAAALATLEVYQEEGIFEKVARMAQYWEGAIHQVRSGGGIVRDIRNLGLLGAVEIEPEPNAPGQRARTVADRCFESGVFVRALADTLILSPPLIINEEQIDQIADSIKGAIRKI